LNIREFAFNVRDTMNALIKDIGRRFGNIVSERVNASATPIIGARTAESANRTLRKRRCSRNSDSLAHSRLSRSILKRVRAERLSRADTPAWDGWCRTSAQELARFALSIGIIRSGANALWTFWLEANSRRKFSPSCWVMTSAVINAS